MMLSIFCHWQHVQQPLYNFLAFPVVSYTCLKANIKSISTKEACDGDFYATRKLCLTIHVTLVDMPLKIIICLIYLFIYLPVSFGSLKKSCVGVSQYEIKSRNRTSFRYSPMYVHQFTSNSKVRRKLWQVI